MVEDLDFFFRHLAVVLDGVQRNLQIARENLRASALLVRQNAPFSIYLKFVLDKVRNSIAVLSSIEEELSKLLERENDSDF